MTQTNTAEVAYRHGIACLNDFLEATNAANRAISWVNAANSLRAAMAAPHISRRIEADACYKLGLLHVFDSDYQTALDYFRRSLSIDPHAFVHEAIGATYYALSDHENSILHYRQAINLGSSNSVGLGRAFLGMGRTKEAIDCFSISISSQPNADALFWKGNAHRQAGEVRDAVESYFAALDADEENVDACHALAEVYLDDKKDPVKALAWFDRMYKLPDTRSAIAYCRTRTPFAAYFCERYPKVEGRPEVFRALCALRQAVLEVKQHLCCNSRDAAIHYTSLDTSKALIVDKSPFRLHRADKMNDPSEGAILRGAIGEEISEEFLDSADERGLPAAYIGSFVIKPEDQSNVRVPADDHLLHWRLYGRTNGAEGAGACVVYPCRIFAQAASTHETASIYHSQGLFAAPTVTRHVPRWQALTPRLYHVAYEGAGADVLIEKIRPPLNLVVELWRAVSSNEENAVLSNCVRVLLEEIRYLFKSKQFEYEREARVVVAVWPQSQGIRADPSRRTEFIELTRNVYPVEVVLGPCAMENPFTDLDALQSNVAVRKSQVSYLP